MPASSAEITVAANGTIYVADLAGTPTPNYPTHFSGTAGTLNATWKDLGYATEDGVTFSVAPNVEDINVWQKATPARREVTGRDATISFSLVQWNELNLPVVFGGGSIYVAGTSGGTVYGYDPPTDEAALKNFAVLVDAVDGTRRFRYVVYRANITEAVETNLVRGAPAVLPVSFGALTPDAQPRSWYMLTDDPQFA